MDKSFFTRNLSQRGNSYVYATLHGGRVAIEKIWLAESNDVEDVELTRRQAKREADTMHWLAVRRDADGNVLSNNNFIFSCSVVAGEDRTTLRMDTEAGWTAAEYRTRWREGRRGTGEDSLPPDDFPQDTMPWPTYLARVLDIIEETAYALRSIHGVKPDGYLHCDIKPANIWVQAGQHPLERMAGVRLIDFGSAFTPQAIDSARAPQALLEAFRHVCGTPGFWSPAIHDAYLRLCDLQNALASRTPDVQDRADNCRRALKALGPADDIYSLTATFFWLLTGQTVTGQGEESIRTVIERSLAALPAAVQHATSDFILGQLIACASAEPPDDCDGRFIRELETLRQIADRTGLYPETLRQCAQQWWDVWTRRRPAPDRYIEKESLPVLSENGAVLDPAGLTWLKEDWSKNANLTRTYHLKNLLEHGKHKNFAIVGIAGIGKTCLLHYTVSQLLKASRIVPLYVPLEQVDSSSPDSLLHFLEDNYLSSLQVDLPNGLAALRRLFANETRYRFYLFLDHLDPANCSENGPLFNQIRELCAFSSVKVITSGRAAPHLGLPVLYTVPRERRYPSEVGSLQEGNWYIRLARFRLCQTVLPYTQQKIFMALTRESQQTVTAAQMNVLWLYHLLRTHAEGSEHSTVQTAVLAFFSALCAGLFRQNMLSFPPEFCQPYLPAQPQEAAHCLPALLQMGLLTRQGDGYAVDQPTRDLGAALHYSSAKTLDEEHLGELRECLRHTQADPEGMLCFLAELSPRHPMPEAVNDRDLPDAARAFLMRLLPRYSILDKLLDFCRPAQAASWFQGRYAVLVKIFRAWVYERGGDLSSCDLSQLDPALLDLRHARLLGAAGPAKLPGGLLLSAVALLPLPETVRWMDWRDNYLLLASEQEAVVVTPQQRMLRLPLAEDCRRVVYAALCPETSRIEVFAEIPSGYRYLEFDLRTGQYIPERVARFPSERMDELRSLRVKGKGWLTSDHQCRLTFWKMLGHTYLLAVPRFSPVSDGVLPEDAEILWEVLPYDVPTDAPLTYRDLRMECDATRVALYDIRQGETLWTERRSHLWEMLRKATKEHLANIQEGTFALLPDGFVFEIQYGLGIPVQAPGCQQWYWLIVCDRHGVPQYYVRYNMNHYNLVEADRWPKDISGEEKKVFQALEKSPTAALNHRVYADGKLYLRSDLKPYLIIIWDLQAGKVERLVTSFMQVEALVQDGDRVIAVCAGRKKGFLLSGTVEEIRHIVPLQELLSSYKRYTPHPQAFVPVVVAPVTAQQVESFAPPTQPGDALQKETLLHNKLVTETIVV